MPLPDYEFYTASYLGEKIPQESFARFITRAARQLERYKSMFDVRPRAGLQEPEACALCAMEEARMPPPAYKTNDPRKMFMQRKFTYRSLFPSGASQPIKPE